MQQFLAPRSARSTSSSSPLLPSAGALAIAGLLSSPAQAAPTQVFDTGTQRHVDWKSDAPPADFGRLVAGDFDGDHRVDLVQLDGADAWLVDGAANYRDFAQLASGVTALAPVRRTGAPDGLALVTAAGLVRLEWDAATTSLHAVGVADASWTGAVELATDGTDLYGLAPSGTELWIQRDFTGTPGSLQTVALGAQSRSLALVDWTGDAALEVAVLTAAGIELHDSAGAAVGSLPFTNHGGFLVAFEQEGYARGRLACVASLLSPGEQWLFACDAQNGLASGTSLGYAGIYAGAAGQLGGSSYADDDLVLMSDAQYRISVFENLADGAAPGGAATFGFSRYQALDLPWSQSEPSAAELSGHPVLVDLDEDGDLDLAAGIEALDGTATVEEIFIGWGTAESAHTQQVKVEPLADETPDFSYGPIDGTLPETQWDWRLLVTADAPSAPIGMDGIEIVTWRQSTDAVGDLQPTVTPIARAVWDLANGWDLEVDVPETAAGEVSGLFWIELRYVATDAGGAVADAGPSRFFAFSTGTQGASHLDQLTGSLGNWSVGYDGPPLAATGGGLGFGMGIVGLPDLPPLQDGSEAPYNP